MSAKEQVIFAPFTYVHVSGLVTERPKEWRLFLSAAIEAGRRADATVIGLTETSRLMGGVLPKGWDIALDAATDRKPGTDENGIAWDAEWWRPASPAYAVRLSDTLWYPEGSKTPRPPHYALVQPLEQVQTGNVVLFSSRHDPPHVDGGPRGYAYSAPRRVEAHREIWARQNDTWREGRKRHPRAGRVLSADVNTDMGLPVWEDRWEQTHTGLRQCWAGVKNPPGTLGRRTIDLVAAGQRLEFVGRPEVLPLEEEFDHNPVAVRLRGRATA